jgi:hypothetical protein
MESICGSNCNECEFGKNGKCKGCKNTNGCPFGKKCFIANYISIGGKENYTMLKKQLIDEVNCLKIDGMDLINELYPLNGSLINLEYSLPNGSKIKFLDDNEIYLGNQVECIFNDDDNKSYFGIVANMNFILVCEYGEDRDNPNIVVYKRR